MGACGEHGATCSLIQVGPRRDACVVAPATVPEAPCLPPYGAAGGTARRHQGGLDSCPDAWRCGRRAGPTGREAGSQAGSAGKRRGAAPAGGPRLDADVVLQRASRAGMQNNTDRESAVLNASSTADVTPWRRGRSQEGRRDGGTRTCGGGEGEAAAPLDAIASCGGEGARGGPTRIGPPHRGPSLVLTRDRSKRIRGACGRPSTGAPGSGDAGPGGRLPAGPGLGAGNALTVPDLGMHSVRGCT